MMNRMMAATLAMLVSVFCGVARAQAQALDSAQIQMLLNQAQDIEGCMSQLDAAATRDLRARSEQVTADIERLCQDGKRDEAQAKALAFGREMADSPAMENLQQCVGPLGALLPGGVGEPQWRYE
jgi:hypothetical protein